MAQIYLDEDEMETMVQWFMDNFELDLTQAQEHADALLGELDFGKLTEETEDLNGKVE